MSKKKHNQRPKYKAHAARQVAIAQRGGGSYSKDVGVKRIWDEVNKMRLDTVATTTMAMASNPLLTDQEKLNALTPELKSIVNQSATKMAAEVKRLTGNLKLIGDTHAGRVGDATDEADYQKALVIYQQYIQWMDDWQDNILPHLDNIVGAFADSEGLKPVENEEGVVEFVEKSSADEVPVKDSLDETIEEIASELPSDSVTGVDETDPPTASQIGLMNNRDTTE